jgi:prephenate dehydrogenase
MEELAALLNRERMLLELLLFKLVALRQLLLAGEVRFLPWAAEEVDRATTKVREAELRRSLAVEGLSLSLRDEAGDGRVSSLSAPSQVTLRTLAESAPEPWRTIFSAHRKSFLQLASDLEEAITTTRRLAVSGGAAIGATLDRLTGAVSSSTPAPRSPAASTYGPGARWEPTTAEPRFTRTL